MNEAEALRAVDEMSGSEARAALAELVRVLTTRYEDDAEGCVSDVLVTLEGHGIDLADPTTPSEED